MKKPPFIKNKIYHIYNRGVEKRDIFMDKQDYLRFIHCLFEFNDKNPASNSGRLFSTKSPMSEVEPRSLGKTKSIAKSEKRQLITKILLFTLMSNHFHLLLEETETTGNGIIKFMQKLGTGYTMYFNQKYKRVGPLFQGRFKAIRIVEDAHFLHIPHYIHSNPLKLNLNLGERGSTSLIEKIKFLENYRWSSFPDYVGRKNFPSVTQREFLLDFFGGEKGYKKAIKEWLKDWGDNFEKIKDVVID